MVINNVFMSDTATWKIFKYGAMSIQFFLFSSTMLLAAVNEAIAYPVYDMSHKIKLTKIKFLGLGVRLLLSDWIG